MTEADEASTSKKKKDVPMVTFCEASTSKQEMKDLEMGMVSESHGHGDSTDIEGDERVNCIEAYITDKEGDEWVKHIEAKLNKHKISRDAGTEISWIPIVPEEFFRKTNEAYKPCIISIGPHHRGNSATKHMEQSKWQCLKDILDRKKGSDILKECFSVLKCLEVKAKSSYSDDYHLKSWDFMEMMLLDSCFIVDYLRQPSRHMPEIDNDLLLLENQLPFLVLVEIFPFVKNERELLQALILDFCRRVCVTHTKLTGFMSEPNFQHLLHCYHSYLFFNSTDRSQSPASRQRRTIHSASFLKNAAGIKFKKWRVIDRVMDAKFKGDHGVMCITPLVIDAFTNSKFQNLVAFERCNPRIEPQFTSFAKFMDYLIGTSTDVRLLRENGIIEHTLSNDEEVAAIFNKLSTGNSEFIKFEMIYEEADDYYKKQSSKLMAILKRKYTDSPWTVKIISIVFGGVLVLLLTIIQTVFAIISYCKPAS